MSFVANPGHLSIPTYLTEFNVLAATRSQLAADMVDDAMCGGVRAQTINKHFHDLARAWEATRVLPPSRQSLVLCHDNNSINYQPRSSRSGVAQNVLNKPIVWTMREAFGYFEEQPVSEGGGEEVRESIQFDPKLRPSLWPTKQVVGKACVKFGYAPPSTMGGLPDGTLTDVEYINKEVLGSMSWVTAQEYFLLPYGGASVVDPELFLDSSTKKDMEGPLPVDCLCCGELNKKGTRNCAWCLNKLRSIADVRSDRGGAALSTLAQKRRPPRARREAYDRVWGTNQSGAITCTRVRLNLTTLSSIVEGDETDDSEPERGGVKVERTLLPSLFTNPNTRKSIKEILKAWGEWGNLAGFCQTTGPHAVSAPDIRQFLMYVSDLGANDLDIIDNPDSVDGENYGNFIYILGVFHECKMWVELVMDLFFSIGGGDLAFYHTYMSEKSQGYLRRCGDLHKANDFLRHVCKPALFAAFLREYIRYRQQSDSSFDGKGLVFGDATMTAWGESVLNDASCVDLKFKNRLFFLLRVLPAYELIKKGTRTGDIAAYHAGRRFLLPFTFALGKVQYGPTISRDMLQYFRAPEAIRREFNIIFGLYDEGINGKVEESNSRQKGFTISATKTGIQAGALLVHSSDSLREVQLNLSEREPSKNHTVDHRTPTDLETDIRKCINYLLTKKVFERAAAGTSTASETFNGTVIAPELTLLSLYDYGVGKLDTWITNYVQSPSHKFPTCGRGRSFVPRKFGGGATINAGADGGEDDGTEVTEDVVGEQLVNNFSDGD